MTIKWVVLDIHWKGLEMPYEDAIDGKTVFSAFVIAFCITGAILVVALSHFLGGG